MKLIPKLYYKDLLNLEFYNHRIKNIKISELASSSNFNDISIYIYKTDGTFGRITINMNTRKGSRYYKDCDNIINKEEMKELLKQRIFKRPHSI